MACDNLSAALKSVWERGTTVVFLLSNRDDIPAWCSAIATVKNGVLQCLDNEEADKKEHILRALFAAT